MSDLPPMERQITGLHEIVARLKARMASAEAHEELNREECDGLRARVAALEGANHDLCAQVEKHRGHWDIAEARGVKLEAKNKRLKDWAEIAIEVLAEERIELDLPERPT